MNTAWKQRWFELSSTFQLKYYETKKSKGNINGNALGIIFLNQIERIEVSLVDQVTLSKLPKYIKVLNTNDNYFKYNRSYLIDLITPNRTYKLSANDSQSFLKWIQYFHRYLYDQVIFESFLETKSEKNKTLNKTYFVLNDHQKYKHLKYFDNKERETLLGCIDLNDPSISLHAESINNYNFIEIVFKKRKKHKLVLYAETEIFRQWTAFLNLNNSKYNLVNHENDCFSIKSEDEEEDGILNLTGHRLGCIPLALFKQNAPCFYTTLILNKNRLSSLKELRYFYNLTTLQLDRNGLQNINHLPKLSKLKTLWLNSNNIQNLNSLITVLKKQVFFYYY